MLTSEITGDLPEIIGNEESLYEGNLVLYFRILFYNSNNLRNPYHNFRHTLRVLWLCQKACRYYQKKLTPRQMRNLLIAALFHDFDHPGHPHPGEQDPDRINIRIAIAGLRRHIMADDRASLPEIEALIEATHYPYKTAGEELDLLGKILRDADLAQVFSPVWIQQVVIGLAGERGVKPIEILRAQASFLDTLSFHTRWARQMFPQELIKAKSGEAEKLARLLETDPAIAANTREPAVAFPVTSRRSSCLKMNSRRRATRFRGQCYELFALAEEEQVAPNEERAGVQVDEACEGGVDLAFGAGLEDLELQRP